jgi:AAA family ATP:ADP antiporter
LKADPQGSIAPPPPESIVSRVVLLGLTYCLLVLMLRSAEAASLSLFLEHMGFEKLPYTFLAISLVDLPLAFLYLRLARALPNRGLLAALAVLLVACLGGARLLVGVHQGTGLFCAYMSAIALNTFIVIQWGVVLLDFFTVEESRRAFPLIYAGAHLGGFAAGLLLRHLAAPLGTANLLVVVPGGAALLAALLTGLSGRLREGRGWRQGERAASPSRGRAAFGKIRLLGTSPLLRAIALATAVMVLLRLALRTCYGAGFEEAFPRSDDMTRFIGTYTIVASVAGIGMQVLVTPRLLARLGVGIANVAYAGVVGASFLGLAVLPGLPSAVAGRAADLDLKGAIKTPLSAMFYEGLDERQRADARALILGVVSPLASLASSLVLIAVTAGGVPPSWIAAAGCVLSAAFIALSYAQGRAYRRALASRILQWHRERTGDDRATLDEAVRAGLRSPDRRIGDMAREVGRSR